MLTDEERQALTRWYGEPTVLERAQELHDTQPPEDLEVFLHKTCLLPLGRHDELPEYMRNAEGGPLFKDNLNPGVDIDKWRDAIEVGWEVLQDRLGITHDEIHRAVASEQQDEWQRFLDSVEQRKRDRS